jgi:hypothetical protein
MTLDEIKTLPLIDLLAEHKEISMLTGTLSKAYNGILRTGSFGIEWYDENMELQTINITFRHEDIPDSFKEFIYNFCTDRCAEKVLIEDMIDKRI